MTSETLTSTDPMHSVVRAPVAAVQPEMELAFARVCRAPRVWSSFAVTVAGV